MTLLPKHPIAFVGLTAGIVLLLALLSADDAPEQLEYVGGGPTRAQVMACVPTAGIIDTDVFGLHTWGPHHTHPKNLATIDDTGVEWLYEGIHWPSVQPTKDASLISETYDDFFTEMAARDMKLLISLGNYWPEWIADPEELRTEFGDMVAAVVTRYRPGGTFAQEHGLGDFGVRYWEIINEPNYPCCGWGAHGADQPVDPKLYAELLVIANDTIRSIDPEAVILFGGLSSGHTYYNPLRFLQEVYATGVKDCFDVLAYHPYDDIYNFQGAVERLRSVMKDVGDEHKPIWFTELGQPTFAGADKPSQVEVFELSVTQLDAVPAFFWFSIHDFHEGETWGMLDSNLEPREPIYSAVKQYIQIRSEDSAVKEK